MAPISRNPRQCSAVQDPSAHISTELRQTAKNHRNTVRMAVLSRVAEASPTFHILAIVRRLSVRNVTHGSRDPVVKRNNLRLG